MNAKLIKGPRYYKERRTPKGKRFTNEEFEALLNN